MKHKTREAEEVERELVHLDALESAHVLAHGAHLIERNLDWCVDVLCKRFDANDSESARATAGMAALVLIYLAESYLDVALSKERR
ncbi:hypothetical protein [Burkholderia sp. LMG 21824]|uniref:hypothetical protein n=1 Tax=Burkholderia sp. LMG 21824 TaxID=3158172 RepID=UPI003C2DA303